MSDIWNVQSLKEHFDALRAADQRALQIKEEGDAKALNLAREIQVYKDEKANQLREQINSERGLYVTKAELKPFTDWVVARQGQSKGSNVTLGIIATGLGILVVASNFIFR
jgi:hypothetical protein